MIDYKKAAASDRDQDEPEFYRPDETDRAQRVVYEERTKRAMKHLGKKPSRKSSASDTK
jgi:hypothetical protein